MVRTRFHASAARARLVGLLLAAILLAASAAQARGTPESFADLVERLVPSVVNVSTTQNLQTHSGPEMPQFPPGSPFEDFFRHFFEQQEKPMPQQRRATSLGSGFVIERDGKYFIITNNHVIEGADEVTIVLQDDSRHEAEVVGRDPKVDLAALRLKDPGVRLVPARLGDSDRLRVGDWVVAIGNPFGLGGTVTAGIVSARGRDINSGPYDDFIQTDASINKGNSGGPMFNTSGDVVGINTAIYSPSGGSVGIGFAVPMAVAKPVIEQLVKYGHTRRGWLGVRIQHVGDEIAESLGMGTARGALVAGISEGGPAEAAGIQAGDVIVSFNGNDIPEMRRLPRIVAETEIGREVDVVVWRDGKEKALRVKVGELAEEEEVAEAPSRGTGAQPGSADVPDLGLGVAKPTASVRERFSLGDAEIRGVVVMSVNPTGPSAEKGVQPGDVIVEINQQEITSPEDLNGKIDAARKAKRKSVLLLLERQGDLRFVAVRLKAE